MKKFILMLMLVVGLAGLSHAAVEIKNAGTRVGKAETLNITGPAFTATGNSIAINTLTETGDKVITGALRTTGVASIATVRVTNTLNVDGTIYVNPASLSAAGAGGSKLGLNVDGTIYKY